MIQIRPWLYQGKYTHTKNPGLLKEKGVEAILTFAESVKYPNIEVKFISFDDGYAVPEKILLEGVNFILEHREKPILVACGAGISRSSSFVCAALHELENKPLSQCLRELKDLKRDVLPHPYLWRSICEYYSEPYNQSELFSR